ncbi:hypothetical protein COO60DRAFT_1643951 [Scenedesmus sp. NREL 46B-D3]|nr:hypothetical protein COO60DRAFT_1643951 [Scenedesmus sp. NREL 46B-D3]
MSHVNRSRSASPDNRVSKKTKTSPSDIKKTARDQVTQKSAKLDKSAKSAKLAKSAKSAKLAKSAKPTKTKLLNFVPTGLKHRVVYTEEAVPKANSKFIVSSTPIRNLGPKTTAYDRELTDEEIANTVARQQQLEEEQRQQEEGSGVARSQDAFSRYTFSCDSSDGSDSGDDFDGSGFDTPRRAYSPPPASPTESELLDSEFNEL